MTPLEFLKQTGIIEPNATSGRVKLISCQYINLELFLEKYADFKTKELKDSLDEQVEKLLTTDAKRALVNLIVK